MFVFHLDDSYVSSYIFFKLVAKNPTTTYCTLEKMMVGRWSFPFGSRWIFTDVLSNFTWGVHQPVPLLEICDETIENGELPERSGGNLLYIDPELCEGPKWATNPWCFLVFSIRSCSTIKSVFLGKMCQFLFLTFDFVTINSSSSLWKMAVWPPETEVLVSGFCHPTPWWKFWQWAQSYQVQLTYDMRWYDNGCWGKNGEKILEMKIILLWSVEPLRVKGFLARSWIRGKKVQLKPGGTWFFWKILSRLHASISSEKGYHDQDAEGKTQLEMLFANNVASCFHPCYGQFSDMFFYQKLFALVEYIIRYIPHPERMSLDIQPCSVADDALINHITLRLPGLGLWQKVIVYLMSRSHETQWWSKSCSFFGGSQTRMNGICISQLDFVHQQYRFRVNLCSQIGIVETAKMLEQQPVTLTC